MVEFRKRTFRPGALGALLDELERALGEYTALLAEIDEATYLYIFDSMTKDEDCRSIATINSHVVHAGRFYLYQLRLNEEGSAVEPVHAGVPYPERVNALNLMFTDYLDYFVPRFEDDQHEFLSKTFTSTRGTPYSYTTLLEHAIVHVLRHRRQIEKFLINRNG